MILIVASEFDKSAVNVMKALIDSTAKTLKAAEFEYQLVRVPGAIEIPVAITHFLAQNSSFTAAIALGCVIKGESDHYELVSQSVTTGLTQLALNHKKPIIQGVLACHNPDQAQSRAHLGVEFALTAIAMTKLFKREIE